MSIPTETAERQEDAYFSSQPPPKNLESHVSAARSFINNHAAASRRVVLVTSGGTTVPLEKQTVRFIDNFSAGTRGATSAEYFLEAGYAVIFLHRQFSLQPYSRHYSHATDCFLDFLAEGDDGTVVANPEHQSRMRAVLRKYTAARKGNMLLMLPFTTITDYLFELRAIAGLLRPLGPSALLYLAAAVSDFFLPQDRMAEHKIQSTNATDTFSGSGGGAAPAAVSTAAKPTGNGNGNGSTTEDEEAFDNFDSTKVAKSKSLVIDLDPVPKFLQNLVDGWAPQGMVVSFKLETDPAILVHKAKYSLERYQHHLVIGNLLSTRKWEVVFVAPGQADRWVRVPSVQRKTPTAGDGPGTWEDKPLDPSALPESDPEMEIESLIIPAVRDLHSQHIESLQK
ncbi:DNA/pantothenate metabolism flavoprotein [Colletotrichum orchidophilum]|uniref:DNA/pantothenate metabolism flavoprotein n=1 Tax=Colletotrichum orchidophilum TaxID=1209926 RepID=A0A1G4BPV4_9PEZI|nr:DNA/pantothenate metabolism flavoprotein [Colletotrichum orchidophilum]OHF03479.1 DNA/pantothenate metabolism flavoprotein [Colletotrichum orchidophilum]